MSPDDTIHRDAGLHKEMSPDDYPDVDYVGNVDDDRTWASYGNNFMNARITKDNCEKFRDAVFYEVCIRLLDAKIDGHEHMIQRSSNTPSDFNKYYPDLEHYPKTVSEEIEGAVDYIIDMHREVCGLGADIEDKSDK